MKVTITPVTPEEPISVQIGARAEGPFTFRLRVKAGEVVTIRGGETLTSIEFLATPELLRHLSREISAGADQPRPVPPPAPPAPAKKRSH